MDTVDNDEVEEMPIDEIIGDAIPKFRALAVNEMNASYWQHYFHSGAFAINCF